MTRRRRTKGECLFGSLLVLATIGAVGTAITVAVRGPQDRPATREAFPQVSAAPAEAGREVVLLGWARPVVGGHGKYRASYVHEIELEDGRKVRYRTDSLYGRGGCVQVRGREETSGLMVHSVETSAKPCPPRPDR